MNIRSNPVILLLFAAVLLLTGILPWSGQAKAASALSYWELVDTNPTVARWSTAMVYDTERQVIVLFGGRNPTPLGDTWEYDGNSWEPVLTTSAPGPRFWHAMAYDSDRKRVVLFGGRNNGDVFGDTWEYDGTAWQQISPSNSPPDMCAMSTAYDSVRETTVLFGGQGLTGELADTWEYDGSNWAKISTANSPPRGTLAAMAFDSTRGRAVLFGSGVVFDPGPSDAGTWEYDGITWAEVNTTASPLGRWAHSMAYDAARQRIVMFGGYGPTYESGSELDDTWEYNGTNWAQIDTPTSPAARQQHTMAYDSLRRRVMMFHGNETWEYAGLVAATLDFDPDTLNLYSKGKWITCYIELSDDYGVEDIDVDTVELSYGGDGVSAARGAIQDGALMVKFDRAQVQSILSPGDEVEIAVSGELIDGTPFEGTDTIRVIE